jgi:hypothetical protein
LHKASRCSLTLKRAARLRFKRAANAVQPVKNYAFEVFKPTKNEKKRKNEEKEEQKKGKAKRERWRGRRNRRKSAKASIIKQSRENKEKSN